MNKKTLAAKILVLTGSAAIIVGGLDPLEGTLAIFPGCIMLAIGAYLAQTRHRRMAYGAVALVFASFVFLIGLSSLGGFGANAPQPLLRSHWWGLLLLPYPAGWMMAVAGSAFALTSLFKGVWARIVVGMELSAAVVILVRLAMFRLVPLWGAALVVFLGLSCILAVYFRDIKES